MSKIGDVFGPEGWIGSVYSDDSSLGPGCLGVLIILGLIIFGFIWLVSHFLPFALLILLWPEIIIAILILQKKHFLRVRIKPVWTGLDYNDYRYSVVGDITFFATMIAFQIIGISLVVRFGWEIYGSSFNAITITSFLFSIIGIPMGFLSSMIAVSIENIFLKE